MRSGSDVSSVGFSGSRANGVIAARLWVIECRAWSYQRASDILASCLVLFKLLLATEATMMR